MTPRYPRGRQLSARDVGELVGISRKTVHQHRRLGRLPKEDGYLFGWPWWWEGTIRRWMDVRPAPGRPKGMRDSKPRRRARSST